MKSEFFLKDVNDCFLKIIFNVWSDPSGMRWESDESDEDCSLGFTKGKLLHYNETRAVFVLWSSNRLGGCFGCCIR